MTMTVGNISLQSDSRKNIVLEGLRRAEVWAKESLGFGWGNSEFGLGKVWEAEKHEKRAVTAALSAGK